MTGGDTIDIEEEQMVSASVGGSQIAGSRQGQSIGLKPDDLRRKAGTIQDNGIIAHINDNQFIGGAQAPTQPLDQIREMLGTILDQGEDAQAHRIRHRSSRYSGSRRVETVSIVSPKADRKACTAPSPV